MGITHSDELPIGYGGECPAEIDLSHRVFSQDSEGGAVRNVNYIASKPLN